LENRAKPASKPVVKVDGISVSFGSIQALRGVSLEVHPGEVVGLLGDNGAGKSTLIKVISGVIQPDEGRIYVGGQEVKLTGPAMARGLGIETVYQDLALAPDLDIAGNLYLGREEIRRGFWGRLGVLDEERMAKYASATLRRLNVPIDSPRQKVGTLSGGQRQSVAIARAIAWECKLVIMDEPTAALGVEESARVLKLIREVRAMNTAVIVISHNLAHVFEVADRVVVLRLGQKVAEAYTKDTNPDQVISWITGSNSESAQPSK